jgi:hypothetical protein
MTMIETVQNQMSGQIRFIDGNDDGLTVTTIDGEVVFTTYDRSGFGAVLLTAPDVDALVEHLVGEKIDALIAEFEKSDDEIRPVNVADQDWDRDDEESELIADAYYYAANKVRKVFGRPIPGDPGFPAQFACAECGTTEATTYVVTTLDPGDVKGTRTEVCRDCDKALS